MAAMAQGEQTTIADDGPVAGTRRVEDSKSGEPVTIDEAVWAKLMDLTDGAATLCFQCGVCTAACPWGLVKDETFSVRTLLRHAQLGLDGGQTELWLCTTCGQCEAYCPRGVRIGDVIRALRFLAWEKRQTPPGTPTLLWSLHGNNNPWGQPPSTRSLWARQLEIPYFDAERHEILLYVGCTAAYDRRVQEAARALVAVLRAAGVSFGYLGDDEPCCGDSALSLGHRPFFAELIDVAAECFRQHGVTSMITISPHCYDAFTKNLWDRVGGIEVMHYVPYLARLVSAGRLVFSEERIGQVTFHDPCYLARHHDETASARAVLKAVPGITMVEMAHHSLDTICCGGGGGRMWLETKPDERFSDLRIGEAVEAEAAFLSTACPFCLTCLEDSAKALKVQNLRVLELSEVLAMAVQGNS